MGMVIYHNPSCATSRKVLGMIRDAGVEPEIILYLKSPPSKKALTDLLARMKVGPRDVLRRRGTPFDELGLSDASLSESALIDAMVAHPILIERPIVVTDSGATLCRPPERVLDLLPGGKRAVASKASEAQAEPKARAKPGAGQAAHSKAQKTHVFRASLDKRHYREFEIASHDKLYHLAETIVGAFGFDFDHAFGFYSDLGDDVYQSKVKYELFADMGDSDARSVKKTTIAEAFPATGAKMTFLFDYGDEWLFLIEMIGAGQKVPTEKYPKSLKSVGKAPKQYPEEGE